MALKGKEVTAKWGGRRGRWERDSKERLRQRSRAAVLWLLSKGSVASSEQTKYWSQLNITFPLWVSLQWQQDCINALPTRGPTQESHCSVNNTGVDTCLCVRSPLGFPYSISSFPGFSSSFLSSCSVSQCPHYYFWNVLKRAEVPTPPTPLLSPVLVYHAWQSRWLLLPLISNLFFIHLSPLLYHSAPSQLLLLYVFLSSFFFFPRKYTASEWSTAATDGH